MKMIPDGITSQLRAVSERKNYGILLYLLSKGEANSYKMSHELEMSEREIERRLRILTQSALVESYFTNEHPMGGTHRPRLEYQPTLSCKQLIFGLLESQLLTEEEIENRLEELSKTL